MFTREGRFERGLDTFYLGGIASFKKLHKPIVVRVTEQGGGFAMKKRGKPVLPFGPRRSAVKPTGNNAFVSVYLPRHVHLFQPAFFRPLHNEVRSAGLPKGSAATDLNDFRHVVIV